VSNGGKPWASGKDKQRIKRALVRRDGRRCWICGGDINMNLIAPDGRAASIDHKVRRRDGGSNRLENLRLAHIWCNVVRD
jgi:5-methylcytosine-specific restriction endonuclease McrA